MSRLPPVPRRLTAHPTFEVLRVLMKFLPVVLSVVRRASRRMLTPQAPLLEVLESLELLYVARVRVVVLVELVRNACSETEPTGFSFPRGVAVPVGLCELTATVEQHSSEGEPMLTCWCCLAGRNYSAMPERWV